MAQSEARDELARCKEEFKSQLEASVRRARNEEARANDLQSQIVVSSQDLSSLKQKYDLLKTEAMNHWEDMAAKETAVKTAKSEFREEKARHQSTRESLESNLQDHSSAMAKKNAELHQARQNLSSLDGDKKQLVEKVSKAQEKINGYKKASDDHARQCQAETTRLNETLSETKSPLSALQHEKETLLRDTGIAGEQSKEQLDAAQQLVNHYCNAYEELVATVLPDKHSEDMSAQELTQSLRDGIGALHELQAARTDAMLEAKEVIESTKSQRDRLTALLNDIFPICVQSLALCERMMMYWRSGMTTAAAASRTRLEEDASETSSKSEMEDENGLDNEL
ncbi:hypothetical protein KC345_g6331 [Hortaea werneckii]|nr:hypothetical protein KC345_g6331 [Hortaea werneckii]